MPKDLLVVLPPTTRRWGDWFVVDVPCYVRGQDQRDEKAPEGGHDREGHGGSRSQPLSHRGFEHLGTNIYNKISHQVEHETLLKCS